MNKERVRVLKQAPVGRGPVAYWMSRDQRVEDNWALLYAQDLARREEVPLMVVFCRAPRFLEAAHRQYNFMLRGLEEIATRLAHKDIPFVLKTGDPPRSISALVEDHDVGALVTDFDPLRVKRRWKQAVVAQVTIPVHEVDGHNIIPCWETSPKKEYAAYTIRPKIHRRLPEFLTDFPPLRPQKKPWMDEVVNWKEAQRGVTSDEQVSPVDWLTPGGTAARQVLTAFLDHKLSEYPQRRNQPTARVLSNLSPYLHFGHLSAQRVALAVQQSRASREAKDAFLEELVVRKELSDNFCHYEERYDTVTGFPDWARETLDAHRGDRRPHLYSRHELEQGRTHDELWNAAQLEMVTWGKMHGYLRMYWAKKILEWTESPEQAMETAIYLNDRYELDGRDPNGYTGIAWAMGGVHDRAWKERPVFGKIRYMSHDGARRKMDMDGYIRQVEQGTLYKDF
ncbi:MAG: deoxyribodipyrimidine photo-lyase [Candidatus Thermoplasmatota archaeon]|nr:deoxyribodipyrimidine photo-lyase [Candidatus Thermoplasmatota archaeon]